MRIRSFGKWTLASSLVAVMAAGTYNAYQESLRLKAKGLDLPIGANPKYFVPVAACLAVSVFAVAAL